MTLQHSAAGPCLKAAQRSGHLPETNVIQTRLSALLDRGCGVQAGEQLDDEIFYTDKKGGRDHECLSLGCDNVAVLEGRTPLQTYADFIQAFARACQASNVWGMRSHTVFRS